VRLALAAQLPALRVAVAILRMALPRAAALPLKGLAWRRRQLSGGMWRPSRPSWPC
jgi:hypothetical protein